MKMEQLKKEIVQDTSAIVQDACKDALTTQVLQQSENMQGSKENYHKLIEGSLPMVGLLLLNVAAAHVLSLPRFLWKQPATSSSVLPRSLAKPSAPLIRCRKKSSNKTPTTTI